MKNAFFINYSPAARADKTVVMLHGLASHPLAMNGLKRRLRREGFAICAPAYPSMSATVEQVLELIDSQLEAGPPGRPLYFVTHSLGGLLARAYIARHAPANLRRVVMLAPPNQGSEYVDHFGRLPLFRAALGPLAADAGTSPVGLAHRLPPVSYEVGIIAGRRALNPLSYWLLPQPNDGIVSVNSTRLAGMRDHLVVPYPHRLMLNAPVVVDQVVHFLRAGRFDHA
jgi:pimeloyl-ACP methyl ester carboxylesterase